MGVARSGTTMMRYLLEASDRIAIARENHFMGHVFGRRGARHFFRRAGDLTDDNSVRKIVDMIYSGEYERLAGWRRPSPYWYWLKDEVPREELERRLLAAERSERGMFEAFLRVYADCEREAGDGREDTHPSQLSSTHCSSGSRRRASSTCCATRAPSTYPIGTGARHRDRWPYTWIRRVPFLLESYLLLLTVVTWPRALRLHRRLAKAYPGRYMMVRFEDVVRKPAETLPPLFEFLGVAMPASISTDVTVPAATRHALVRRGHRPDGGRSLARAHPAGCAALHRALPARPDAPLRVHRLAPAT